MGKEEEQRATSNMSPPSIFANRPDAWSLSKLRDNRSLAIIGIVGAMYCVLRYVFVGIGGHGALSIRPADAMFMLASLFGWPWGAGMVFGEFIASYSPVFGGYGFLDAMKQLLTCLIKYPVIILLVKKFDPKLSKPWTFLFAGAMVVLIGNTICATYLNILYQIPIMAFMIGSVPGSIVNEIVISFFVVFALRRAGAHFLPAKEL